MKCHWMYRNLMSVGLVVGGNLYRGAEEPIQRTNNGTGTGSSGSSGTKKDDVVEKDPGPVGLENPAVIAAIVVTCLVLCCCISIGILTIPHKTKSMFGKRRTTLAKARASLDVTRGAKRERPGMATLAQREILAAKMEGSQWWYLDLEGEEQGPYSTPGEARRCCLCCGYFELLYCCVCCSLICQTRMGILLFVIFFLLKT